MNAILTTLWIALCTVGGYWGGTFVSDTMWVPILFALLGFFIGLILRFCPRLIGDIFEGIADIFT